MHRFMLLTSTLTVLVVGHGTNAAAADTGLNELAARHNLNIGMAVMPEQLDDPEVTALLKKHCNYLTPENHLKWERVHPKKDVYDFVGADKIVEFAERNGMRVRGHTLVWHQQLSGWVRAASYNTQEWKDTLHDHIKTVMTHYRGKIRDWDVINEPLDENGQMRETLWYLAMGPQYIDLALQWARASDPNARLYINDYGIEQEGAKSDALYKLVKDLKSRNVPIDGIGMQFHLEARTVPDWGSVVRNIERFAALGLTVQFTEVDVRLTVPPSERAVAQQTQIYAELTKIALAYSDALILWGVSDKYSWIPGFFPGYGSALLFDEHAQPKPAYAAVHEILASAKPTAADFARYAPDSGQHAQPAFRAARAPAAPVIDGVIEPHEWDAAYVYPYLYNQLDASDQRPSPSPKDSWGTWRLLYRGNTLYGLVSRRDDVTVLDAPSIYENDCIEIFFSINGTWKQYRTVVGRDWQTDNHVPGKAQWSADGTVLEFEVTMPRDLTGLTIGWNTALADNDVAASSPRKCQLYPVTGNNSGWQGRGYAELTFANDRGQFVDGPVVSTPPPFTAARIDAAAAPTLNGDDSDAAWRDAPVYPLGYNQAKPTNQDRPDPALLSGDWRLLVSGSTLYGLVHRAGPTANATKAKPAQGSDRVEIALIVGDEHITLVAPVGQDFLAGSGTKQARAVWKADGTVLEFIIETRSPELSGKRVRWSIGLIDAGGDYALFPFPGYRFGVKQDSLSLGEQMRQKERELAQLQLP